MKSSEGDIFDPESDIQYGGVELFHPAKIFLALFLTGLVMVFLFLTLGYLYTRIEQGITPIKVKPLFILNTLTLLASSYTIFLANKAYKDDDTEGYKKNLLFTIGLSLLFMILQIFAWQQLMMDNTPVFDAQDNAKSYLQVISALHFIHVFGGLPFLIIFYIIARKRMVEPVSVLVYFSDPQKKLHLNLLTTYWHFLDILWIYLVLFFTINSFF